MPSWIVSPRCRRCCLLRAQRVVARQLEGPVESLLVVARIDAQPGDGRSRLVERRDQADPSHLGRVLADLPRQRVHCALEDVRRLGPPRSTVRVRRRGVRHHAGELVPVGLHVVRAHVDPAAELRDAGGEELEVRPHVGDLLHPDAEDLALLGRGQLDVVDHAAPVDGGHVVLRALLDPLHRPADLAAERQRQRLLRVDVQLRAEAAADVGRDDPQLRLGDAGHAGERHLRDVRDLRGRPQRELALGRDRHRQTAARLDRVRDQARLDVPLLHHDRRRVEDRLVAGAAVAPVHDRVACRGPRGSRARRRCPPPPGPGRRAAPRSRPRPPRRRPSPARASPP